VVALVKVVMGVVAVGVFAVVVVVVGGTKFF